MQISKKILLVLLIVGIPIIGNTTTIAPLYPTPAQSAEWKVFLTKNEFLKRIAKYDINGYLDYYVFRFNDRPISEAKNIRPALPNIILSLTPESTKENIEGLNYKFDYQQKKQLIGIDRHKMTEKEKQDIIMLINLTIDDDKKAHEIFDKIYANYLNKIMSGEVQYSYHIVASDISYQGRLFELAGFLNSESLDSNIKKDGIAIFSIR